MKSSLWFTFVIVSGSLLAQPVPPRPAISSLPFLGAAGGGSFLGVGVAEISSDRARALNLKEEYGVEITHVAEDSPAGKAGLKQGDVVLEYNGQAVEGIEQFQRLVRETPAGRTAKLLINRNGAAQTISAVIGARKGGGLAPDSIVIPHIEIPDMPNVFTGIRSAVLGVEVESLGPQLAEYFGAKDGGVLVRSVVKGSAAEKAGIKAGDVIAKVNDVKVATAGEISGAIRNARSEKSFPLEIVRDRREMTVTVTLDESGSRNSAPSVRPVKNPL